MAFLKEPEPRRREALFVLPGIRRIVANNPSLMTYHGTNTYLIETSDGAIVLDPGPDDDGHLDDVIAATHGAVSAILLSHSHSDHLGATSSLKARTRAPVFAFHRPADPSFEPDGLIRNGDIVAGMTAIHTPGHASDHLCFARPDGVVFSADHVMSWSSSIVSPPDGNMAAYCDSLRVMLSRDDRLYLPGHGPALPNPRPYVADLLKRRILREEAIFAALAAGPATAWDLMDRLYSKTDPWLRRAAERNVLAHLDKLHSEGLVEQIDDRWQTRRTV
ncbi:MBL fold metallo-hydrolase [Bosea sp. BH3]|uniref:MBL fold metallo-hydrolase n=1 Tax=Bosea sp. BH3 TaxID=2871701 RepID=UPI0021CB616F|nr:MBL fold metallo-hydrolase [Bosea sp. BH3]MCU4179625.1 MBL fold metallo-hydrolase [Bosea sp. BH3]